MEDRKPVTDLSNRELLEESAEILRTVRGMLAEFEPLLAMVRAASGNGASSYVKAAGMRRAIKRGAPNGNRAQATRPADPAPGPGRG